MGHVLGFGTLWNDGRALLLGGGSSDPRFVGTRADAEYCELGGSGTSRWRTRRRRHRRPALARDDVFGNELMTGFIATGSNPLSAMSIASMADLGYQVSLVAADPYTLPGGFLRAPSSVPATAPTGVMLRPTPIHF